MSKILEKAVTESISPGLMAHLYTTKVVSRALRGKMISHYCSKNKK